MNAKQRRTLEDCEQAYGPANVVRQSKTGRYLIAVWAYPRHAIQPLLRLIGSDGNVVPTEIVKLDDSR